MAARSQLIQCLLRTRQSTTRIRVCHLEDFGLSSARLEGKKWMAWRSAKYGSWQQLSQVALCALLSVHGGALYLASTQIPVKPVMPMPEVAADMTIRPTPSPDPLPAPPVSTGPKVLGTSTGGAINFGIASGGLADYSDGQLNSVLAGMQSLGVRWVRFDIDWSIVQAGGPGSFDWSSYDRLIQAAGAHGLRVLAILDYTPDWARRADCGQTKMCVPADAGMYANFAAAAAAHYSGQGVHTWEIWNEENTSNFFQPAANPGAYTALLKAAYSAIKQSDGGAVVITGGLAPSATDSGNFSPIDFANGMYEAGASGFFDAFGDHPYTYPAVAGANSYGAWGQMSALHQLMIAHGDGDKKIWITEYGAPTNGPDSTYFTSETGQAQELSAAVDLAVRYSWVGSFFWYTYLDPGNTTDTNENFFGLVRSDGSFKPAYAAYQAAIGGR